MVLRENASAAASVRRLGAEAEKNIGRRIVGYDFAALRLKRQADRGGQYPVCRQLRVQRVPWVTPLVVVRTVPALLGTSARTSLSQIKGYLESKLLPFLYTGDRTGEAELGDLLDEAVRLKLWPGDGSVAPRSL